MALYYMKYTKHIVFITPGFPQNESDSSCLPYLQTYFKAITQSYPHIRFSAIAMDYPFDKHIYECHKIMVYACGGKNRRLPLKLLNWKSCVQYFKKINKIQKVDFINSFWLRECAILGNYLSKQYQLPHCVSMVGQDARASNRYLRFLNLNQFSISCLSPFQSKVLEQHTQRKADYIIPLGLDAKDFANVSLHEERDIDIIGVGNLGPVKNYPLFIKMIARLKEHFPNIKSCIVGGGDFKGSLTQEIEQLIVDLDVKDNVLMTGHIERTEVLKYIQRSKIFLHTSNYESQGYVFLEALFLGMYLVSFEVGIAQEHPKWSVAENEEDMLQKLKLLMSQAKTYDSVMLYDVADTVEAFAEVYQL